MPDWRWLWHAEIEKFPAAVMATRHPSSVNLGDVTTPDFCDRAIAIGIPDVLVFGSPCQSYSVAGKRLGLDDPRGNLALVALGIVDRLRPAWFVFENVPGLFSSWSGAADGPVSAGAEWDMCMRSCRSRSCGRHSGVAARFGLK
jgi:DNA (cytosine-5)-methyltransferase 1